MSRPFFMSRFTPQVLGLVRIVLGFLFLCHGTQKLFGWPIASPMGTPALFSLIGFGAVLELLGGALLIAGLFTRPVAFILSGEMAVAYFMAHASHGVLPIVNHGEPAVLYCFAFLLLSAIGGGAFSVDNMLSRTDAPASAGSIPLRRAS